MNVSAAIPGGAARTPAFRLHALKGVPILARTAEPDRAPARGAEPADRLRAVACRATREIDYDGPAPAGFVPRDDARP